MRALRIELLRSWRTFSLMLPLVVVLCLVFAGILRGLGATEGGLITLHFYTVGLLIPIAVLTGVLGEFREAKSRYGGTLWRSRNKNAEYFSRVGVATAYATLGHLAVPIVFGFTYQSWAFVLSQSAAFFFACSFGMLLWHIAGGIGMIVAMPLALAWDVLAFYKVQDRWWILNPASWNLRASLPIFGAHPNSTAATPGDPIWSINPWPPVLAQVLAAIALIALTCVRDRRSQGAMLKGARKEKVHAGRKCSTIAGLTRALPTSWVIGVGVFGLLLAAGLRVTSGTDAAIAFTALVMMPACGILSGVLVWYIHERAWLMLLYRVRGWKLYRSMLSWPLLILSCVAITGGILAGAPFMLVLVLVFEVCFAFQFSLLLAMRSTWLALSLSTVWMVWSILICGSELSNIALLRLSGVLGWAYLVKDLPQFSAVALLVLLILTLSALGIGSKKAQRPIRLG